MASFFNASFHDASAHSLSFMERVPSNINPDFKASILSVHFKPSETVSLVLIVGFATSIPLES